MHAHRFRPECRSINGIILRTSRWCKYGELSGAKAGRHDFFVGLELVGEIGDGYKERLWVVIRATGDCKKKMRKRTASMKSQRKGARLEFAQLAKRVVIHCFQEARARSTAIGHPLREARLSYSVEKRVGTIRWILESRHR